MVTLIATGHKENGLCNSNELYKIIEQIAPDIIFEEIPPGLFLSIYEGTRINSLETFTIKKYLENHTVAHIPVDHDTDNETRRRFVNEYSEMTKIFAFEENEYIEISHRFDDSANQIGFPFLNSDECSKLLELKNLLEEKIVRRLNLEKLTSKYNAWSLDIESRNNKMLENIYSYSDSNPFNSGLFLVGTAHRWSIMNKVYELEKSGKQRLEWNFSFFE